jgi:hypothetical protein
VISALFVLRIRHEVSAATKVTCEVSKTITSAAGNSFSRSIDFITDGGVWYELKNWQGWGQFPPRSPKGLPIFSPSYWWAVGQSRALKDAEKQFMTVLIAKGPAAATEFKMDFTKGPTGLESCCATAVRDHFMKFGKSTEVKQPMVNAAVAGSEAAYNDTVAAMTATAIRDMIQFR